LTERIRRAAIAPIRHCLLPEALLETGIGTLILARGTTADQLAMGAFLIDVWCLGVKDALFQSVDAQDFEMYVDHGRNAALGARRAQPRAEASARCRGLG
jgi:hypothetical protein